MSLPPLPPHPWRLAPIWDEDEQKALQAYGQQCREQALLDAINATRAFSKTGAVIAAAIRSLK